MSPLLFFFTDRATSDFYALSLHDALPIWPISPPTSSATSALAPWPAPRNLSTYIPSSSGARARAPGRSRSEEHTSELQSRFDLVCRLLLEKKKEIPLLQDKWQSVAARVCR